MSFNYYSRKVRDSQLKPRARLSALHSCISRLSFLEKQSYSVMRARLYQKYDLNRYRGRLLDQLFDRHPNDKNLLAALEEVETERRLILNRLRIFAEERVQKKRMGERQLSSEEREHLKQLIINLNSGKG